MGCRGPVTYNACSVTRWNEGTSYPIQSGHGCIGCSENNFWDNGPFYRTWVRSPASASSRRPTRSAPSVGVATAAGVAAHAISTNIRKRKLIRRADQGLSVKTEEDGEGREE